MKQTTGIIAKSARRNFEVLLPDQSTLTATAKGNLLKGDSLVVGDVVELNTEQSMITEVHERTNSIYRFITREKKRKTIAANIDILIVIMSMSKPDYKRGLVDRYLLRATQWNVPSLVVFNKLDEYEGDPYQLEFEIGRLHNVCEQTFMVSATTDHREFNGIVNQIEQLQSFLKDKTAILLGQSGVGKSTLINKLSGDQLSLRHAGLGAAGKGSHTTTWAELVSLGSFRVIDSPGIRSMSLNDLKSSELSLLFPDLAEDFTKCQFRDCTHSPDSKGCYFNELEDTDENEMKLSRLDSYIRFLEEISQIPDWEKN